MIFFAIMSTTMNDAFVVLGVSLFGGRIHQFYT